MSVLIFGLYVAFILAKSGIFIESSGSLVSFSVSSDEDIKMLTWGTPFEGIRSNMFDVTRVTSLRSQVAAKTTYLGVMLKRGEPLPDDYIKVSRHSTLTVTFDISEYYRFDETGEYKVTLRLPAYSGAFEFEVLNNQVLINITKSHLFQSLRSQMNNTFVSCSQNEVAAIKSAVTASEPVLRKSYSCLLDGDCKPESVTWFGTYAKNNYDYVQNTVFFAIDKHLQNNPFKFTCHSSECSANTYAYVFPSDRTFTVHLCQLFFTLPNERIETIIHEMSHFNSLGATDDVAYGRTNCLKLAKSNPYSATHNADNICYFASDL